MTTIELQTTDEIIAVRFATGDHAKDMTTVAEMLLEEPSFIPSGITWDEGNIIVEGELRND